MKVILAATDFTPAAHNATVYAASLARVFNARLILYNAYQQILTPAVEAPVFISTEELKKYTEEKLTQEVSRLDPYSQLTIETACTEHTEAIGIEEAARRSKADIIVTGMKSQGKGIRRIIGSTVTALLRKSAVPVIVVPEEARSGTMMNIALATDSDASPDSDPHMLDTLCELGERFSSKLYLIRVTKNKFEEAFEVMNRPFKINRMVSSLDPVYQCIEGKEVATALNDFIKSYNIDMLALVPHKHSLLERWFSKSTTRSMIFETEIPLLILPEVKRDHAFAGRPVSL